VLHAQVADERAVAGEPDWAGWVKQDDITDALEIRESTTLTWACPETLGRPGKASRVLVPHLGNAEHSVIAHSAEGRCEGVV
jgi:hypothetical protein